ncbi:hypothetical protein RCL1_004460 [Eukaryota sp. TZLM3-RCL]
MTLFSVTTLLSLLSDVLGVAYFFAWSLSFYPQFRLNHRRKSVVGLSFTFTIWNLIGFTYYSVYTIINYFKLVENPVTVAWSDVLFAVHAAIITSLTCIQILIYDRGNQKVSFVCIAFSTAFLLAPLLVLFVPSLSLSVVLGTVKLSISLIKYTPQIFMNLQRKSCSGFNINNMILDTVGAVLSFIQMVVDGYRLNDWSVFNNFTKLGLSFQSVFFDLILIYQHFVLYCEPKTMVSTKDEDVDSSETTGLLNNNV